MSETYAGAPHQHCAESSGPAATVCREFEVMVASRMMPQLFWRTLESFQKSGSCVLFSMYQNCLKCFSFEKVHLAYFAVLSGCVSEVLSGNQRAHSRLHIYSTSVWFKIVHDAIRCWSLW